ncbi:recombinase family protein [Priestia flexa]|uniref:recombinase family protein n=1 Tax=Priestia flexa TaxID=86664 RepID=UPI001EF71EE5|nr:recombinase family protein [Priestia flexa]MCG7314817.1 recombinase family protein [Priestia flexa]
MFKQLKLAVGYIRTASLESDVENIVRLKQERISRYCTTRTILIEEIIVDRGSSGLSPLVTRIGGGLLIDYIMKGETDCIVVHHLFELSRDIEELHCLLKIFKEKGITLIDLSILDSEKML